MLIDSESLHKNFTPHWLGLVPYNEALNLQLKYWQQVRENPHQTILLGLEHPTTITLGKRGKVEEDLKISEQDVSANHWSLHTVDRGGQATLHSPGQLVVYPIVCLETWKIDIKCFVHLIHKSALELLAQLNIPAEIKNGVGIYTEHGKICFSGLRIEHGVSRHGMSLNVSNDLKLFDCISSCGVNKASLDSIHEFYSRENRNQRDLNLLSPQNLFESWTQIFKTNLENHRLGKNKTCT